MQFGAVVAGFPVASWKKGQSGNPSGRPKGYAEVEKLARQHTQLAIDGLVDLATGDNPTAKGFACSALLDRGWGKAVQRLDANVNVFETLTDGTLDRLASILGGGEGDAGEGSGDSSSRAETHH